MTKYRYEYSEWSVDTRTWVLTSKKQLTEEEVYEIFHTETDIDEEGYWVVLDDDKIKISDDANVDLGILDIEEITNMPMI